MDSEIPDSEIPDPENPDSELLYPLRNNCENPDSEIHASEVPDSTGFRDSRFAMLWEATRCAVRCNFQKCDGLRRVALRCDDTRWDAVRCSAVFFFPFSASVSSFAVCMLLVPSWFQP